MFRNEGVKLEDGRASYLSQWVYGSGYSDRYQAGRIIQSCHPTSSDWLKDLQLDLRAAVTTLKTASCIVADTETWLILYRHSFISFVISWPSFLRRHFALMVNIYPNLTSLRAVFVDNLVFKFKMYPILTIKSTFWFSRSEFILI